MEPRYHDFAGEPGAEAGHLELLMASFMGQISSPRVSGTILTSVPATGRPASKPAPRAVASKSSGPIVVVQRADRLSLGRAINRQQLRGGANPAKLAEQSRQDRRTTGEYALEPKLNPPFEAILGETVQQGRRSGDGVGLEALKGSTMGRGSTAPGRLRSAFGNTLVAPAARLCTTSIGRALSTTWP